MKIGSILVDSEREIYRNERIFVNRRVPALFYSDDEARKYFLITLSKYGFDQFIIYSGLSKYLYKRNFSEILLKTSLSAFVIELLGSALERSKSDLLGPLRGRASPVLWNLTSRGMANTVDDDTVDYLWSMEAGLILADNGFSSGVMIPISTENGGIVIFHLLSSKYVNKIESEMILDVCNFYDDAYEFIYNRESHIFVSLTAREKECLFWASEGKTSSETANITGLSEHTINHYLTCAARKLNCVNRIHAVTKALRGGFI